MYRDEPPEPDWVGEDDFTCSMEVERQFITPSMTVALGLMRDTTSPARLRNLDGLLREWKQNEPWTGTCGWEGRTEVVIGNGVAYWTCPCCGTEHEDSADRFMEQPDPEDRDE